MTTVQTVQGSLDVSNLGSVLMHEHIFILTPELDLNYPKIVGWDEDQRTAEAVQRLKAAKDAGIDTVVDLTVLPMGRDVQRIKHVSEASGVNVVVASGLYTFDGLPKFLEHFGPGARFERVEPMVEMFVGDVSDGIGNTGIKAGIFKCATDAQGVTRGVERVLRAVAQAHRATGAPISTHTDAHTERGLEQQAIFEAEGVDLSRVIIGHCGDTTDLKYLRAIADRGSYLGMDRFGMYTGPVTFDDRVNTVADLCRRGYAEQIVLSHDASCFMDWLPRDMTQPGEFEMPDWHYCHISEAVIPALRQQGVTVEQVESMLITNPARALGSHSKGPY